MLLLTLVAKPKVAVWCGIHGNTTLGPVFLKERVNAERYPQLLHDVSELYLGEMPFAVRSRFYFQQDGAPPHLGREVRSRDEVLFGRWIGRRPIE